MVGVMSLTGLWPVAASAQQFPSSGSFQLPSLSALSQGRTVGTTSLVLEGAVDPAEYVVGPGDVFAVSIGGGAAQQLEAIVSADGRLAIPEVGSFEVAGRMLNVVLEEIRAAVSRQNRNVTTDATLVSPRSFFVHVSGVVPQPGRHAVAPVARVEDALAAAIGENPTNTLVTSPRDLADYTARRRPIAGEREERRPALRNVRVQHRDGSTDRIDLMRYFATGDVRFNPTLRDGDAVTLPAFDPVRAGVSVSGAVDRPGVYDVRPDDRAWDLVVVATGVDAAENLAAVRLTRASGETLRLTPDEARQTAIGARDQIHAEPLNETAGLVEVAGAVQYPGTYPVQSGITTLAELVSRAGGLRDDALARGAFLERPVRTAPEARQSITERPLGIGTKSALPQQVQTNSEESASLLGTESATAVITEGQLSDLGLIGRRYYAQELDRTPRVSVDMEQALSGATEVPVRDGDRLVVPVDLGVIRVFGQVAGPGYVSYVSGQTARDYVRRAGGEAPAATNVYVVKAGSGRLVQNADEPVLPGDAVFVDRQLTADLPQIESIAIQERREQRESLFRTLQVGLSAAGAVISIIAIITRN